MNLVFIGQKATTGTPNRITGYYSIYGDYKKFKTRKERDDFYDSWRSSNPSEQIWKCGESSGRKFSLGCSVEDYKDYLNFIPYTILMQEECNITGKIRKWWETV